MANKKIRTEWQQFVRLVERQKGIADACFPILEYTKLISVDCFSIRDVPGEDAQCQRNKAKSGLF